jgi:hypothetical protein
MLAPSFDIGSVDAEGNPRVMLGAAVVLQMARLVLLPAT